MENHISEFDTTQFKGFQTQTGQKKQQNDKKNNRRPMKIELLWNFLTTFLRIDWFSSISDCFSKTESKFYKPYATCVLGHSPFHFALLQFRFCSDFEYVLELNAGTYIWMYETK